MSGASAASVLRILLQVYTGCTPGCEKDTKRHRGQSLTGKVGSQPFASSRLSSLYPKSLDVNLSFRGLQTGSCH